MPERELADLTLLTTQAQAQLPQRAGLSLTSAQAILDNSRQQQGARDGVLPALGAMTASLHQQLSGIKRLSELPPAETAALRLRMTLTATRYSGCWRRRTRSPAASARYWPA
ncbi:hypothetical protein HA44_21650 [Mixta gaviniae]|nr:hypothetical protein HA44_21650 [Mixta gaviniae]